MGKLVPLHRAGTSGKGRKWMISDFPYLVEIANKVNISTELTILLNPECCIWHGNGADLGKSLCNPS